MLPSRPGSGPSPWRESSILNPGEAMWGPRNAYRSAATTSELRRDSSLVCSRRRPETLPRLSVDRPRPMSNVATEPDLTKLYTLALIFDGDPPYDPRGAPVQAWSVACTLQAWHALQAARETRRTTT